jgi:hypothetical protein
VQTGDAKETARITPPVARRFFKRFKKNFINKNINKKFK